MTNAVAPPPQIIMPDYGFQNRDLRRQHTRLEKSKTYRDLSTICVTPIPHEVNQDGLNIKLTGLPIKVVSALRSLIIPMNQKFIWIPVVGMEVGAAYESIVEMIMNHPDLSNWKYLLTMEWDNVPPPDGLMKLFENIRDNDKDDGYDVVGGLYWTKGVEGQPMCYGDPSEMPRSFRPQLPPIDCVKQYSGLGMGFNLFRLSMFKENKLTRPWFKTQQDFIPGQGFQGFSQDLFFYNAAGNMGYKFACDGRVKVGHYDVVADVMW